MTRFTAVLTRGSAAALVGAAFALGASPARAKDDHGSHMSHHYYPHAERQALREHNVRHREPNRHRHDHRDNDAALGLFLGLGLGAAALGALSAPPTYYSPPPAYYPPPTYYGYGPGNYAPGYYAPGYYGYGPEYAHR